MRALYFILFLLFPCVFYAQQSIDFGFRTSSNTLTLTKVRSQYSTFHELKPMNYAKKSVSVIWNITNDYALDVGYSYVMFDFFGTKSLLYHQFPINISGSKTLYKGLQFGMEIGLVVNRLIDYENPISFDYANANNTSLYLAWESDNIGRTLVLPTFGSRFRYKFGSGITMDLGFSYTYGGAQTLFALSFYDITEQSPILTRSAGVTFHELRGYFGFSFPVYRFNENKEKSE